MNNERDGRGNRQKKDTEVTIEGLSSEIARLNDELTCASEAHEAIVAENNRLKETLRDAEAAFRKAGNDEMAGRVRTGVTGERPKSAGFKLPSSRRVA